MHAIGFEHAYSFPGRDEYYYINCTNIDTEKFDEFHCDENAVGFPGFSEDTVMHYGKYAAANRKRCGWDEGKANTILPIFWPALPM